MEPAERAEGGAEWPAPAPELALTPGLAADGCEAPAESEEASGVGAEATAGKGEEDLTRAGGASLPVLR